MEVLVDGQNLPSGQVVQAWAFPTEYVPRKRQKTSTGYARFILTVQAGTNFESKMKPVKHCFPLVPFIMLCVGFSVSSEILRRTKQYFHVGLLNYYTVPGGFNRPFPSCFEPHYESKASCIKFLLI